MSATLVLMELAGHVVLLLWGMRMVHSGVVRAYGSSLRRVLGARLSNRFGAAVAGMLVTVLLQSSTATALMTTSFAADGVVALVPALAVMLGANIGTALVVRALSFDIAAVSPVLLLVGYVAFRRADKGRVHDLGRVGIGLGLMLLALHLLVVSIQPAQTAPVLGQLLAALTREPVLAVVIAAALTWLAHSSVATILLIVSLAGANVVTPVAALALVLGANVGSAIPPVLAAAGPDPAARRLPVGNLLVRLIGCIVAMPFLYPLTELLWGDDADPATAVVNFHLAFNIVLAAVFLFLLDPAADTLRLALPRRLRATDPGQPLYLDQAALNTPYLALANAEREVLRMGDMLQQLLAGVFAILRRSDRAAVEATVREAKALAQLQDSVKSYLTRLTADPLSERDARRCGILLTLAINLGAAGSVVGRSLGPTAARKLKRGIATPDEDNADLLAVYEGVSTDLRLAQSTLMTEDTRSAQELLDAKRRLNDLERAATRAHLARLDPTRPEGLEASAIHLATLRDLRRINSHLAAVAYDVLEIGPTDAGDATQPEMDAPEVE